MGSTSIHSVRYRKLAAQLRRWPAHPPRPKEPMQELVGRLTLSSVNEVGALGRGVSIERVKMAARAAFRIASPTEWSIELLRMEAKKVVAPAAVLVDDALVEGHNKVGRQRRDKGSTRTPSADIIVHVKDSSGGLGQHHLSDFAQLSKAARLWGVSLRAVQKAIAGGRLTRYHLGGGTVVVSLIECKQLWEHGVKVGGRPRTSKLASARAIGTV